MSLRSTYEDLKTRTKHIEEERRELEHWKNQVGLEIRHRLIEKGDFQTLVEVIGDKDHGIMIRFLLSNCPHRVYFLGDNFFIKEGKSIPMDGASPETLKKLTIIQDILND